MSKENTKEKQIKWTSLAIMTFTVVWGFQNAINGFDEFNGVKAVIPWIAVMIVYFLPYCLMVGELGSTFVDATGGVASWVGEVSTPVLAFMTGWIYWAAQLPFISQKPSNVLNALSWMIFDKNCLNGISPYIMQPICLVLFLFAVLIAQKGINVISKISSIAGTAMFIMSLLFIAMLMAAPAISNGRELLHINWSWDTFKPALDSGFVLNMSILLLAVGGSEMISPYVNKVENKTKGFKKGVIAAAIMVMVCAVLGTLALGFVIDPKEITDGSFDMANGAYIAFQRVGEYYFGNIAIGAFKLNSIFTVIYAASMATVQFSVMMIAMDAPLRMLLREENKRYLPKAFFKKNKNGTFINGYIVMVTIISALILLPMLSGNSISDTINWLTKLNSLCVPLTFELVFMSYILLKKKQENFNSTYKFVKNKYCGMAVGIWCFALTAVAIVLGMYSTVTFELVCNIIIPIGLVLLGFVMIAIKKAMDKHASKKQIANEK